MTAVMTKIEILQRVADRIGVGLRIERRVSSHGKRRRRLWIVEVVDERASTRAFAAKLNLPMPWVVSLGYGGETLEIALEAAISDGERCIYDFMGEPLPARTWTSSVLSSKG